VHARALAHVAALPRVEDVDVARARFEPRPATLVGQRDASRDVLRIANAQLDLARLARNARDLSLLERECLRIGPSLRSTFASFA